jgi:hypothetical protein
MEQAVQDMAFIFKDFKEFLLKDSEEIEGKVSKLILTSTDTQELNYLMERLKNNDMLINAINKWAETASKVLGKDISI